jgi:NAD+ kinase
MLVVDGQEHVPLVVGARIQVSRAPVSFRLARVAGRSFYKTLRDKLHWGAQPNYRNEPHRPGERTAE